MSLSECMNSHTERQFRTWIEWLDSQWNEPSLTDHYLMQIATEVRRVLSKNPNDIKLDDFKIEFSKPKRASKAD